MYISNQIIADFYATTITMKLQSKSLFLFFPAIGIMPYFSFFPGVSLMPYKAQQGHNGVMTAGVPSKGIKEYACHMVPIVVSCKLLIPPHNNIIIFWRFA
tara:strand:- start:392 stop:691 length:300 start_codon:yes stop_codon:yes gene_type:complete